VFAAIWVVYDTVDLAAGTTERAALWLPHPRNTDLMALQLLLVVSGTALALGAWVWIAGMTAAAARAYEALAYFPLNDFYFVSVVALLLAHSEGGPFGPRRPPRWVRDALLVELAWVYAWTAILKLSPDWLDGGHLFVRTQYLASGAAWPYPAAVLLAFAQLRVDAAMACLGVAAELTLAFVVLRRAPYWLAVGLALAIHGFGTLVTNVWFFSATMIAAIALAVPRSEGAKARGEGR
jgi:hypothetical protein